MVTQQMLVSVTEQWIVYRKIPWHSLILFILWITVNSLSLDLNSRFSDKFSNQLLITSSK
jgi:di/tricarboxylate transporter